MSAKSMPVIFILAALCVILLGGCAPTQAAAVTPTANSALIGTISRVNNEVQRGVNASKLVPVTGKDNLNAGDYLQVSKGGEGLLDFGNFLQLRVFNDTNLQAITLEHAENIPLYARIQLETGGFTGTLQKKEGKAVFETPNGVTITILGTQFWVIYNASDKTVGVGNFGGTISITAQGVTRAVTSKHYVIVRDGQPPEPEQELTMDRDAFEALIRKQGSPLPVLQMVFAVTATPSAVPATATSAATATQAPSPIPSDTPIPPSAVCPPTLQVLRSALCRVGPGTSKEVMNVFAIGTAMVPTQRTDSNPVWWNVAEPASGLSCWVSSANLDVQGDPSCVPVSNLVIGNKGEKVTQSGQNTSTGGGGGGATTNLSKANQTDTTAGTTSSTTGSTKTGSSTTTGGTSGTTTNTGPTITPAPVIVSPVPPAYP